MRGHERPVVEALARVVADAACQEGGARALGGDEVDLHVPAPAGRDGHLSLDVLQVGHVVLGAITTVALYPNLQLPIHRDYSKTAVKQRIINRKSIIS